MRKHSAFYLGRRVMCLREHSTILLGKEGTFHIIVRKEGAACDGTFRILFGKEEVVCEGTIGSAICIIDRREHSAL